MQANICERKRDFKKSIYSPMNRGSAAKRNLTRGMKKKRRPSVFEKSLEIIKIGGLCAGSDVGGKSRTQESKDLAHQGKGTWGSIRKK